MTNEQNLDQAQMEPVPTFFISPCQDALEQQQRVLLMHNRRMKEFARDTAIYTGGDPHRLAKNLGAWLRQHRGEVVLVIGCHGAPERQGDFKDTTATGRKYVSRTNDRTTRGTRTHVRHVRTCRLFFAASGLWKGFCFTNDREKVFCGLVKLLRPVAPQYTRVHIVCSQCYGLQYAERLRQEIEQRPVPGVQVLVYGLSDQKTRRVFKRDPDKMFQDGRLDDYCYHEDLLRWFRQVYRPQFGRALGSAAAPATAEAAAVADAPSTAGTATPVAAAPREEALAHPHHRLAHLLGHLFRSMWPA